MRRSQGIKNRTLVLMKLSKRRVQLAFTLFNVLMEA